MSKFMVKLLLIFLIIWTSHANAEFAKPTLWQPENLGIEKETIISFAIDPNNNNFQYAGSYQHGLFFTRDGKHWQSGNPMFAKLTIKEIYVDPILSSHIFMIVNEGVSEKILYRSIDAGQTWEPVTYIYKETDKYKFAARPTHLVFNPLNSNEIYEGDLWGRIWKSVDNGKTWNVSFQPKDSAPIMTIAINPKNPRQLFFGIWGLENDSILYKTDDAGLNWTEIKYPFANNVVPESIAIDPTNPNNLYIFSDVYHGKVAILQIIKSTDSGATWQIIPTNFALPPGGVAAFIDLHNSHKIFALMGLENLDENIPNGKALYVSNDDGKHWEDIKTGLPNFSINSLTYNYYNLYVGLKNEGVYTAQL